MGLDNYFRIKKYETPDWTELDIHTGIFINKNGKLCGGLMSGHGSDGSFRGKVYNDVIEELTGQGLYVDEINHKTIQQMAERLNEVSYESAQALSKWDLHKQEWEDLKKLFNKAAETDNCVLLGWW